MSQFTRTVIRCAIDVTSRDPFADFNTGKTPSFWNSTDVEFQFAFFNGSGDNAILLDVSDFVSVVTDVCPIGRTGAAYMSKTVAAAAINTGLTPVNWQNGTDQHVRVTFTAAQASLPLGGGLTADFFLRVYGQTNTIPASTDVYGASTLTAIEAGISQNPGPVQAGNVVPGGATYDGAGHYVLAVTANQDYTWTPGANDTSITNGTQNTNVSGVLITAQGATVTLVGTPSQAVTAVVRTGVFLTADQSDARYVLKSGDVRVTSLDDGNTYKLDVRIVDGVAVPSWTLVSGGGNVVTIVSVDDGHTYYVRVKIVDGVPTTSISSS